MHAGSLAVLSSDKTHVVCIDIVELDLDERPDGKRRIACDRVIGLARANAGRSMTTSSMVPRRRSMSESAKATPEIDEGLRTCGLDFGST